MEKEHWMPIVGFSNYEISDKGRVRKDGYKMLVYYAKRKVFGLWRNKERRYFSPARLLYAAYKGIDPTKIGNVLIIQDGNKFRVMSKREFMLMNRGSKRNYDINSTKQFYKSIIDFSELVLKYYKDRDITALSYEIQKYEERIKRYIVSCQLSYCQDTINEAWRSVYEEVLTSISEGRASIVDPYGYLKKATHSYFIRYKKMKTKIIPFEYNREYI